MQARSFKSSTQFAEREDFHCQFLALSVNGKDDYKWQKGNKWCRTFQHPSQNNSTRYEMSTFSTPKTMSTHSFWSGAVSALLMCFSVHSSSPDRGSKSSPPSARPPSAAILSPRSEYFPKIWLVQNGCWHWLTGGEWMHLRQKPQRPRIVYGSLAGALRVLGRSNDFVNEAVNTMPGVTATHVKRVFCWQKKK